MTRWTTDAIKNLQQKRAKKLPKRYGGFMPCHNEHALARQIVDDLLKKDVIRFAWKHYNGGVYNKKRARYISTGSIPGFPDTAFVSIHGLFCGIECKKDKGSLSKEQREIGSGILECGGIWFCTWSFEQYEFEFEQQKHKLIS